jgi:hypothetical protein
MKAKTSRKGLKVAISLLVAFAMIGIPANSFSDGHTTGDDGTNGTCDIDYETALYGEPGTPPYDPEDPTDYARHEDNRYKGTDATDPYSDAARRPTNDTDVTYLNQPDPTVPHDEAPTNVVTTVTNWGTEARDVRVALQVYKEVEPDPFMIWKDDMESCYTNWTTNDLDGDGNTWARTEEKSVSPTHSWHNVKDCSAGTYVANSEDELVIKKIDIPEMCGGEKPTRLWFDFQQWIRGEMGYYMEKFEDYGTVYYRIDDEDWQPVARYQDSFGEWVSGEPDGQNVRYQMFAGNSYDYDAADNPIGWVINGFTQANETVQFKFTWTSDPSKEYEGWYIDDFVLYGMCGATQELVDQQYKPVSHPLHLEAFDNTTEMSPENGYMSPFQTQVQFHFGFDPEDDVTYFFEAYTVSADELGDVDGAADYNGAWMLDSMTGNMYWDPLNGVNESVYFGDWHDGKADDISIPTPEIRKSGDCVTVPIDAHVSNQGTIAEAIPYTVDIKKAYINYLIEDDVEDGEGDWQTGYFDNECEAPSEYWHVSDTVAHSGTHSWGFCEEMGTGIDDNVYPNNAYFHYLLSPVMDISSQLANNVNVQLEYFNKYSIATGDDMWFGVFNPNEGLLLRFTGLEKSGSSGGWVKDGISITSLYQSANSWFLANNYAPMTGEIGVFWTFISDATGIQGPDGWGGYFLDDIHAYSVSTGETVWSSSGTTDVLTPGEQSDDIELEWEACDYSNYMATITTNVEDDWNSGFKGDPDLGYMYNDEARSDMTYIHRCLYEENFDDTDEMPTGWSTHDNTFGVPGNWEVVDNGVDPSEWTYNQYAYTGEGSYESESEWGADDCLVPATEDGDIKTFKWGQHSAVEIDFDLWNEIEYAWDYLTLEVTNDSGDNWWTVAAWNNLTNVEANQEVWQDISIELFNGTDYIPAFKQYDVTGLYNIPVNVGLTDEMTFRFHLLTDASYTFKGAYIDNVEVISYVNETIPQNGHDNTWMWTHTTLFEDDFESGTLDKWLNIEQWTGSMWHHTDTCSYSGDYSVANFDYYTYSNYNKWLGYTGLDNAIIYDSSYGTYRNTANDKIVTTIDLSGVYQAYLRYMLNYSIEEGYDYYDYQLMDCNAYPQDHLMVEISTDDGETWHQLSPYGYAGDSGGWVDQYPVDSQAILPWGYDYGIDLTEYAGQEVMLRWHLYSNASVAPGAIQLDDLRITGKEDTEAPVTTAVLGPSTPNGENGWYVSDVTVTLNAEDREMGTTYYRIDGGSWQTYSSPFTVSDDGKHTVEYYSVDAVGNEEEHKTVSFKIDQTNPTANLEMPQAGRIYLFGRDIMPRILFKDKALIIGPLTASASASDGASGVDYVTFETSKGSFEDAVSPYEYALPFGFGSDTLTISVADNAGNANNNVASVAYLKIL